MERRVDDLSFEGAWKNQVKEEQKERSVSDEKKVKVHEAPAFRGQREALELLRSYREARSYKGDSDGEDELI